MSIGRDNLNNEILNLVYQRDSIEKEKNRLIDEEGKLADYIKSRTEEVVRYYNAGIQEADKAIDQHREKLTDDVTNKMKEQIETVQKNIVDLKNTQADLEKDIKAKKAEKDTLENGITGLKAEILMNQVTAKNLQDTVDYWTKVKNIAGEELVKIGKEYHNTKKQVLFGEI
jgi:chromosome segregation ATPase